MTEVDGVGPDVAVLYSTHRMTLLRLAMLLVDDVATAEDVVQEAFAELFARQSALRDPEAASAYLHRSVVNASRSVLRRRATARRHLPGLTPPEPDGPDRDLLLAEEHREVLTAIRALPSRQREVLVLRYWSGLSENEIAEALGISRGAVKSQASRALDKLEKSIGGIR